jgi:membrane fusion protein (multidrug efflux system)
VQQVLVGIVLGALLVAFVAHVRTERARRAPAVAASVTPAKPGDAAAATRDGRKPAVAFSQTPITVVTAPVRVERLSLDTEALGTARANESVDVTSKVSNIVTAVRFDEGQYVRRGRVLVELDSKEARADLAVAEAALTESRSQFKRSRELYSTQALSEAQLEQIEATLKANDARVMAARARVDDTVIVAPFAGRVGLRRVSPGSLVSPGTVITTLDDTATIKLDFTVPEAYLPTLSPGLPIQARSIAYPGRTFAGRVGSIDSRVDPTTRSLIVRALLPNPEGRLKPGMFLTVQLSRGEADSLVVPEEALVPESGDVFVYVVRNTAKDATVEKRAIKTGQRRVGNVEVIAGLAAGDSVVIEGTQKLRDGAPVAIQPAPQPAQASTTEPAERT